MIPCGEQMIIPGTEHDQQSELRQNTKLSPPICRTSISWRELLPKAHFRCEASCSFEEETNARKWSRVPISLSRIRSCVDLKRISASLASSSTISCLNKSLILKRLFKCQEYAARRLTPGNPRQSAFFCYGDYCH